MEYSAEQISRDTDLWSETSCILGDRNINSFKNWDFKLACERATAGGTAECSG